MYYYKETTNGIEKYNVSFDKEKLAKLRIEIIDNCSEVTHHKVESTIGPDDSDKLKIRNNKKGKKIGVRSYECGPDLDLYNYDYDEYTYPYLAILIDKLLHDDVSALDEIINPNIVKEKHYDLRNKRHAKKQIEKAFNEYEKIDYFDIRKKKATLLELEKLILENEKMVGIKPVAPYYKEVANLINLRLVDILPMEIVEKVNKFYENNQSLIKIKKK